MTRRQAPSRSGLVTDRGELPGRMLVRLVFLQARQVGSVAGQQRGTRGNRAWIELTFQLMIFIADL